MNTLLKLTLALSIVTTAALSGLSEERSKHKPKPDHPQKPVVDKKQFGQWLDKQGYVTDGPKIKNWIDTDRDRIDDRLQPGPGKPAGKKRPEVSKPKPTKPGTKPGENGKPKPTRPIRPEPPVELKTDMNEYKQTQQELQKSLRAKIVSLGKKPSREAIRKVVEQFRDDNSEAIDSQKELGKKINEWHKDNRPPRPERPEPTVEMKQAIEQVKSKQKALTDARKDLLENIKGKSKEEKDSLVKEFKSSQQQHLNDLKTASKELREITRSLEQTGDRRR